VLLVQSDIYYVPVDDGWEVVLVCNVLHYVPVLHYVRTNNWDNHFMSPFSGDFEGTSTFLTPKLLLSAKKIMSRTFLNSGTLIVRMEWSKRLW
jgi:hypothetical protein